MNTAAFIECAVEGDFPALQRERAIDDHTAAVFIQTAVITAGHLAAAGAVCEGQCTVDGDDVSAIHRG